MKDACLRLASLAALALLLFFPTIAASAANLAGRPVIEVLAELKDTGLEFIYSSELLPSTMQVLAEPRSTSRLAIAREILAAHGLGLVAVRPGLYAVVRVLESIARGNIHGQVLDARSGKPIPAARLELLPIGSVQWSDAHGRFSIGPVPEGVYTLRAEAAEFDAREVPELSVSRAGAAVELRLAPTITELAEVVVATSRYAVDQSGSFGSVLLDGETLAALPSIGEDAIRSLARLPGIAQSGVSAQSNIRGGESGEVLVLLDGFPLRQAFHMPGYQSVFGILDPGLIEEVEVYTGGFPARYGNRMAGVFDLQTRDAASEPHTALGLSVFNAVARHGGDLEPIGAEWLASARVGTLNPLLEDISRDTGNPTYSDVYARVGFGDPGGLRISGNVLWSRDELSITREDRGEQAQIDSRARYLWLRADRDWGDDLQASLWLGHSRIDSVRTGSIDDPSLATGVVDDSRASEFRELRGRFAWRPGLRHWFEAGVEWTEEDANYRYSSQVTYPDDVATLFDRDASLSRQADLDPDRERIALFASHRWQLSRALVSEIGLRAQRATSSDIAGDEWAVDPRFNLRWQLASGTSLRAHWGRFHQADEVHELKVEDGLTAFPAAQRSDHLILGIDHRLPGGRALRFEGFRKLQTRPRPRFENMLDVMSVIPELAPDRILIAPSSAEVRGAEFSVISEGIVSTRWVALAWSDAADRVNGRPIARSWDQTWAVTTGVDWFHGHWRLGAVAAAHRGWPATRIHESGLRGRNADRLPTFASLDLRAEYRRPLSVGSLALTFELTNALNRRNICCSELIAADDGNGGTTFDTRDGDWLPIVPSIGVLWEF